MKSYDTRVVIEREGEVGEVVGSSDYGILECGGTLTYLGTTDEGAVEFRETLTFGQATCIGDGTVTLAHVQGRRTITYDWRKGPRDGTSSGVLDVEH